MQTRLASGRASFSTPIISTTTGGSLDGNNTTFYFWIKARNRVGYNQTSAVKSLTIANDSTVTISATNFNQSIWEDFRHFIVCCSTSNDFSTSRVIYKFEAFDSITQIGVNTPTNVVLNDTYILLGPTEVPTPSSLPILNVPNGYRIRVLSLNTVFEFVRDDTTIADNISVLDGEEGTWKAVSSNSLTETSISAFKELSEVTEEEYLYVPLENFDSVAIKYYIYNNTGESLDFGELNLNEFFSTNELYCNFDVRILGYLNLTTYVLDTVNIDYINTTVSYPLVRPSLSKSLPNGSALVLTVAPDINISSTLTIGSSISIYPTLNSFEYLDSAEYWDDPVDTLNDLADLTSVQYKNNQIRFVISTNRQYRFDNTSTEDDNGDSVIAPNSNPISGRWLSSSITIPNNSITTNKLSNSVLELLDDSLNIDTITIPTPTNYLINLNVVEKDYFIINCPASNVSNTSTIFNVDKTLENNDGTAIVLELRQSTGVIEFHSSILFPGGETPVLSGNNKTDLVVIKIIKDGAGNIKKRGFIAQRDIG